MIYLGFPRIRIVAFCEGSEERDMVCAGGVYERGKVNGTKFITEAKALGKSGA